MSAQRRRRDDRGETTERRSQELERMREAVERKSDEAARRSHGERSARLGPDDAEDAAARAEEESLFEADRSADEMSVRAKSTGHGKKTADKWNQ